MPDNITPKGMPTAEEVAAHNTEIARKLSAQQDVSLKPVPNADTISSLDELLKKAETSAETKPDEVAPVVEPKPDKPPTDSNVPPAPPMAAPDDPVKKRADELFKDSPTLPPGASPKSSEAFSTIKIQAAKEISAKEAEIDALKKQILEATEAAKNPTTEQLEKDKELEDLRTWRAKVDVDADPKFKEFDKNVSQAQDFIYSMLRKSSVSEDIINKIKSHGGPEMVKLGKVFEQTNDPVMQRIVEAKVADIEQLKWQKEQAIKTAKENIKSYVAEREKAITAATTSTRDETNKALGGMLKNFTWLQSQEPAANATDDQKKQIEDANKFAKSTSEEIAAALSDDSPNMRAILIAGTARGFYVERLLNGVRAELEGIKKERDALTQKLTKIKAASRSQLSDSAAPQSGNLPASKVNSYTQHPGDALDAAAKQVMEEHARKNQAAA